MKHIKILFVLPLVLITLVTASGQNKKKLKNRPIYNDRVTLGAEGGQFVPTGSAKHIFDKGISGRLFFAFPIAVRSRYRISYGFHFIVPKNKGNLFYFNNDSLQSMKVNSIISPFADFTQTHKIPGNFFFDVSAGVAWSILNTNVRRDPLSDENQKTVEYMALRLSAGAAIRYGITYRRAIGLNLRFHKTFWKKDPKLQQQIGQEYITLGLSFGGY